MAAETTVANRVRVLIADMPELWIELLTRLINRQPDMVVSATAHGEVQVLMEAAKGVDVIVLGTHQRDTPPGVCSHLLSEFPAVKILVFALGADTFTVYWLGLRRKRMKVTSGEHFAHSIRAVHEIDVIS